jgi:hypothetical protein
MVNQSSGRTKRLVTSRSTAGNCDIVVISEGTFFLVDIIVMKRAWTAKYAA